MSARKPRPLLRIAYEEAAEAYLRSLPLEQCPAQSEREQDPPQVALATSVLQAVLGDLCARSELAPNLSATTQDLKSLVRAHLAGEPPPEESLLTHGWRSRHLLPELQAILEGKRLLRIADIRSEAPL